MAVWEGTEIPLRIMSTYDEGTDTFDVTYEGINVENHNVPVEGKRFTLFRSDPGPDMWNLALYGWVGAFPSTAENNPANFIEDWTDPIGATPGPGL